MGAVPVFSNQPRFQTRIATSKDVMSFKQFNAMTEANVLTSSSRNCANELEGALFRKNIIHQVIRTGGPASALRFFEDIFPINPLDVNSKTIYNHYITDIDYNVYVAASAASAGPNNEIVVQLIRSVHSGQGMYSYPEKGFFWFDKDNQIMYIIKSKDTSIPYAHKVTLSPADGKPHVIKQNKAYLIGDARAVGGMSCPQITNAAQSLGYVQRSKPIRLRRDWSVEFNLMRSYEDLIQFPVIYDKDGNFMDSWDLYETQMARQGLRGALNLVLFIGSPITNPDLVSGFGAVVDPEHTGGYGFFPTVRYGGGIVQDFDPAIGWDLQADWEPLLLYQDSLKRSKKLMVMHGLAFKMGLIDRANRLVERTGTGSLMFEAYKRLAITNTTEDDPASIVEKLNISQYKYLSHRLDFMLIDAFSDTRYLGSDYFNNVAVFLPLDGITIGNKPAPPFETYQYGAEYTGGYEEFERDMRQIDGCEYKAGYVAQSIAWATHGQNQMLLANPRSTC